MDTAADGSMDVDHDMDIDIDLGPEPEPEQSRENVSPGLNSPLTRARKKKYLSKVAHTGD